MKIQKQTKWNEVSHEKHNNWNEKSTARINSRLNADKAKFIEPEDIENSINYPNWNNKIETNIKRKNNRPRKLADSVIHELMTSSLI